MAIRNTTAVSLIKECEVSLVLLGYDNAATAQIDWVATSWPTEGVITLALDQLRVSETYATFDSSAAQAPVEKLRTGKGSFTISIESKLQIDGLDLTLLTGGKRVVGINCVSQKSSFWVPALLEQFDVTYANPSTLTATCKSYGFPIQWDTSTDFPT